MLIMSKIIECVRSITISKEHNTFFIARYMLGILFNAVIAIKMLAVLADGGMQDVDWDYCYDLLAQIGLLFTCVLSAYADWLILQGKRKMFVVLLISNLIYWICCVTLFTVDPKTGIYYYAGMATLFVLMAWLICSLFSLWVYKKCMKRRVNYMRNLNE